jgi:23S rRNA (uracil1939-C5)-methyltransferase
MDLAPRGNGGIMASMTVKKGHLVDLVIDATAYGAQGVARVDGLVVFVKGAVPGDRVMARIVKKKRDYAEARVTEVVEPSPDRVPAPCPYSGYCGGCQWQHLRYDRQLAYKRGHIEEALARIGTLPGVRVLDVIPSKREFSYRNKMEFSFSDRRWLLPEEMEKGTADAGFALGLHVPGTFNKVIDVEACLLQRETGNRILREVKEYVRDSRIPVYGLKSHQGFWRFLTLRHSSFFDEWMVNLVTSEEKREALEPLALGLRSRFDNIRTVVNNVNSRRAGIAVGERETVLAGEGTIEDRIGPFTFRISANSFFQTNSSGAERLYAQVAEYAELTGRETVLDLYSGTGTIPIFLSDRAKAVMGMEISRSAILDAQRNCEINGIEHCRFLWGDIRERLAALSVKPDVLIIDPPRAGMHKDVLAGVMAMAAERVVYVSCNPATLARDLAVMNRDYEIVEIQPVDMFPHTYHIEAVSKLVRRSR